MKHTALRNIKDYEDVCSLDKSELDAIIASELFGYTIVDKSIVSGAYYGYIEDSGNVPIPEPSSRASVTLAALNKAKERYRLGAIFIEWWNDGQWFVCNRPQGHRNGTGYIESSCDGRRGKKDDLPLAVTRFIIMALLDEKRREENG